MISCVHRIGRHAFDLAWWTTIQALPASIRIVHHLLMLMLLRLLYLKLVGLFNVLKVWHLQCPILIQMRVHLGWRFQSLHDQVAHRAVPKLVDYLLSTRPIACVHESHDSFDRGEPDSLLLVVEHLEQHFQDLVRVKLRAHLLLTH